MMAVRVQVAPVVTQIPQKPRKGIFVRIGESPIRPATSAIPFIMAKPESPHPLRTARGI